MQAGANSSTRILSLKIKIVVFVRSIKIDADWTVLIKKWQPTTRKEGRSLK